MKQIAIPAFSKPQEGYKVYQRFRGVDYSTDETQIADSRSPYMLNMISDSGGYPELRLGWRTIHKFTSGGKVHSIYPFIQDGVRHMIAHVGTQIVRLVPREKGTEESYAETVLLSGLADKRSNGFYFGGDLWILTGAELVHYNGVIARRASEEAYVPTTSVGCQPTGGGKPNEKVNLIGSFRKNTFVTDGTAKKFTVDTKKIDEGSEVTAEYINKDGKKVTIKSGDKVSGTTRDALTFDPKTGVVTLDTAPPAPAAAGVATLTIKFSVKTEGSADKINGCTIFTTFGVGTGSRVFLSGNPKQPNTEYYCGLNDPTYWPDAQFIRVGTDNFPIVNYLKYQGELLVIKQDNRQENTVWHHAAELDPQTGTALFPLREGVSGIGGIAPLSCQVLRDDPLFLSPQGVFAPVLTYSMNTIERNLQCRSTRINVRLGKEPNLKDAISAVWKGYYILCVNGHCYVADANQSRDKDGYEWYYWEGIPAYSFGVDATDLYFGTEDGRLCRMNNDLVDEHENPLMRAYSDDGQPIPWEWRSKLDHLDRPTWRKTLNKRGCGVQLKRFTRGDMEIYLRTEKDFGEKIDTVQTDRFTFSDVNFNRFTFGTTKNLMFILKKKLKKFLFVQVILRGTALNSGAGLYMLALYYSVDEAAKKKRK